MFAIAGSGIMLLISIVLNITLETLSDKFETLKHWLPYFKYIIIAFAVITFIFVVIGLIKYIKNK